PNIAAGFPDPMLDVNFLGLVAGEGSLESSQQAGGDVLRKFLLMVEVRGPALFAEEEPVASGGADSFAFLEITAIRREPGADADHDDGRVRVVREPEMFGGMNEGGNTGAFLDALGEEAGANAFAGAPVADEPDVRDEEMGLFRITLQARGDGIEARLELRERA